MRHVDTITLAAARGAGTMTGFFVVLVIADLLSVLDVLLDFLAGVLRAVCQ